MTIESYDPTKKPHPGHWLELDEGDRIDFVSEFHRTHSETLGADAQRMHSVIHVIVENQLAMEEESVVQAMSRLRKQGMGRHETLHAIGAILAENIFEILQTESSGDAMGRYCGRLNKLTATRWEKGTY
jgi:hypothetical protein